MTAIRYNHPDIWADDAYMNQAVVEPDGRRVHLTGQVAWDRAFNVLAVGNAY